MQRTSAANAWLVIPKPNAQARARLFCFPYAGGGAFEYRAWSPHVPHDLELCAAQLPGRETRLKEAPFTRLLDLTKTLAEVIAPYLDKPFAFFGHSLGAFIGFELARQLRWQNLPQPAHLFVSGSRAPQLPNPEKPMCHLPDHEFVDEIVRRYDSIPQEAREHAELMAMALPALRADFTMNETYEHAEEPPLSCPITCFGGVDDHSAPREHLEAWRAQTRSEFTLRTFPGGHFFIKPERAALAQIIAKAFEHTRHGKD